MIKMVIFCVIAFALTWLPFNALIVIGDLKPEVWEHENIMYIWFITHYLAMCHTITNPLIYIWMNNRFRAGFKQVIGDLYRPLCKFSAFLICFCLCCGCIFNCSRRKYAQTIHSINGKPRSRQQLASCGSANYATTNYYTNNNNNSNKSSTNNHLQVPNNTNRASTTSSNNIKSRGDYNSLTSINRDHHQSDNSNNNNDNNDNNNNWTPSLLSGNTNTGQCLNKTIVLADSVQSHPVIDHQPIRGGSIGCLGLNEQKLTSFKAINAAKHHHHHHHQQQQQQNQLDVCCSVEGERGESHQLMEDTAGSSLEIGEVDPRGRGPSLGGALPLSLGLKRVHIFWDGLRRGSRLDTKALSALLSKHETTNGTSTTSFSDQKSETRRAESGPEPRATLEEEIKRSPIVSTPTTTTTTTTATGRSKLDLDRRADAQLTASCGAGESTNKKKRPKRKRGHAISLQMTTTEFYLNKSLAAPNTGPSEPQASSDRCDACGPTKKRGFRCSGMAILWRGTSGCARHMETQAAAKYSTCRDKTVRCGSLGGLEDKINDISDQLQGEQQQMRPKNGRLRGKYAVDICQSSQSTATISAQTNNTSLTVSPINSSRDNGQTNNHSDSNTSAAGSFSNGGNSGPSCDDTEENCRQATGKAHGSAAQGGFRNSSMVDVNHRYLGQEDADYVGQVHRSESQDFSKVGLVDGGSANEISGGWRFDSTSSNKATKTRAKLSESSGVLICRQNGTLPTAHRGASCGVKETCDNYYSARNLLVGHENDSDEAKVIVQKVERTPNNNSTNQLRHGQIHRGFRVANWPRVGDSSSASRNGLLSLSLSSLPSSAFATLSDGTYHKSARSHTNNPALRSNPWRQHNCMEHSGRKTAKTIANVEILKSQNETNRFASVQMAENLKTNDDTYDISRTNIEYRLRNNGSMNMSCGKLQIDPSIDDKYGFEHGRLTSLEHQPGAIKTDI